MKFNDVMNQDPWGKPGSSSNGDKKPQDKQNQNPPDLEEIFSNLLKMLGFGGNGSNKENQGKNFAKGLLIVFVLLVAFWAISGFYTIKEAERGVVTRFGKLHEVASQGLNWKITFVDKVYPINIERISQLKTSGAMLTQDENMVQVEMTVQYRIENPADYLFNVVDPDISLKQATDSALRYVIGHMSMDDILTTGRSIVREKTWDLIKEIIKNYKMGLTVTDVNFQSARPPEQVKEAFDDAIKAQEDEQRLIREAEAYARGREPIARGLAQQMIEQAAAYKDKVVLEAEGETSRFLNLLPQYRANPSLMRERLYIESIERIMQSTPKILLDTQKGNEAIILPLDKIMQSAATQSIQQSRQKIQIPQATQPQALQPQAQQPRVIIDDRTRHGRF